MKGITADFSGLSSFVEDGTYEKNLGKLKEAYEKLTKKSGAGAEFTGWVDLPEDYDKEEFERIKKAAKKIRSDSDALVVIGIGGSYLGACAACDFLKGEDYNMLEKPQILFAGNSLSAEKTENILKILEGKDYSINVISKSGTTMETALAFRIFRSAIEEKYGIEEAGKRIYVTTDKKRGALKELSDREGYESFVVPDDIGGRYSVLTAVGLLPIAAAGGDIDLLMKGAAEERKMLLEDMDNQAVRYALARQKLYGLGKAIELFAIFDPDLGKFTEWLKQLFGESEGKGGKGLFPAAVRYTTDLHSMGQMVQDGERNLFETVINAEESEAVLKVPHFAEDFDGYQYLEGKNVSIFNDCAVEGTIKAHQDGGVPGIKINFKNKDEENLGGLFYFFEFACGISAYLEEVNPFDQPGVEAYKKNIKTLLAEYKKQQRKSKSGI